METDHADYSSFSDASFRYYERARQSILRNFEVQNNGEQSHTCEDVQVKPSDVVITISSDEKSDDVEVHQNSDGQTDKVCRICLCSSESVSSKLAEKNGLIQLGCECKGNTGLVHVECAQTWFRTKGNSICEICGSTPKNIFGVTEGIISGVSIEVRDTENAVITTTNTNEMSDCEKAGVCCFVFIMVCAALWLVSYYLPPRYYRT